MERIPAEFFAANRERLRNLFTGTAPIVFTANGLLQRNSDVTYPFRQDSNFWYLTGINEPDIILVIDKNKEYLIVPGRSDIRETFDGSLSIEELQRISGIQTVLDEKAGWKTLGGRISRAKHVATIGAPKSYSQSQGFYANPARKRLSELILAENPSITFLDLRPHLVKMRSIKQPIELQQICAAIEITVGAFQAAVKELPAYSYEYELEAGMHHSIRSKGAQMAYGPIVAAGKNACVLHYIANDKPISANDSVLIDIGAEVNNYAADITRTVFKAGMTKRQEKIFNAVAEVQDFAYSMLRPGVLMRDYEQAIEQFTGEKLRELGLIKVITHDDVRKYFPHSTSHFLGLDVHDIGDYELPLEANMVMTVEPGIYIPEEQFGVRIEDNVLLTDVGVDVLSKNLPRDLS